MATNTNDNSFQIVGTVTKIEEREKDGDKYLMINIVPAWCKRWVTFFVSPTYKSGSTNPAYIKAKEIKVDSFVKITVSPFNNRLFLFNIKPFNVKEEQGDGSGI